MTNDKWNHEFFEQVLWRAEEIADAKGLGTKFMDNIESAYHMNTEAIDFSKVKLKYQPVLEQALAEMNSKYKKQNTW